MSEIRSRLFSRAGRAPGGLGGDRLAGGRWRGSATAGVAGAALVALVFGSQGVAAVPSPVEAGSTSAAAVDGTLSLMGEKWGDDTTGETVDAAQDTGTWQAADDLGSSYNIAKSIGAQTVWGKTDPNNASLKLTGVGVGVALIDTGIAPVEGLLTVGKVVNGPDLSFDSQSAGTRYGDGYGHGTHMAAIIAGKDSKVKAGNESDSNYFTGMAPDATLVNVKVAAGDGGVDVSQVIAGIDWVVTNRLKYNIRVLNLSYGTNSTQASTLDPLAHAVESAWRAGIVVVVAAGNDGESGPTPLTMPAIDPYVIAVGSADHQGGDKPEANRVGPWTNSGTTARRPDLIAPGKSVVSLRVPGGYADLSHPEGRVLTEKDDRLFRGTGTSQSAAVVSGAVALMMQRNPALSPDQVKGVLKANADKLMTGADPVQGAGLLDIKGAVEQLEKDGTIPEYSQTAAKSTGHGTLDASRAGAYVTDPATGITLRGEQDPFGVAWDSAAWAPAATAGNAWTGGTWRGSVWAGAGWSGTSWAPIAWSSRSWSGQTWSSRSWSTMTFLSRSWSGDDWASRSWSAENWVSRSWSAETWTSRSWSAQDWVSRSWSSVGYW